MEILESRQGGLVATLDGNFPELRSTVWQSAPSVQAAVQALTPQMTENKKKVRATLALSTEAESIVSWQSSVRICRIC